MRVFTSSLMATSSRRAALELPAHADVDALGVLAEDDEVDVLRAPALERDEAVAERADGADVRVEVEAEAQAEQDVAGVLEPGTRGSPSAPSRTALASRAMRSCTSGGYVVPSRR